MYDSPAVSSSAVGISYVEGALFVLLVSDNKSSKPVWHIPTTFVSNSSTSLIAFDNYLLTSIGIAASNYTYREQLYTTESLGTPRAALNVSYLYVYQDITWHKGTMQVGFFPVTSLPPLSHSDTTLVRYALERLEAKLTYTTLAYALLTEQFTLHDLQRLYETVFQKSLDKRNFRKRIEHLDILEAREFSEAKRGSKKVQLYSFRNAEMTIIPRSII